MTQIFFTFISLGLISNTVFAMSPPWYYYQNILDQTIGQDPCVEVLEPQMPSDGKAADHANPVVIPINVCEARQAENLAILSKTFIIENIKVEFRHGGTVVVKTEPNWTAGEVKANFESTFRNNPLFVEVGLGAFGLAPTFEPAVVQFFCDNISVPTGYCHFLASDAFEQALETNVSGQKLFFTTALKP